MANTLHEKLRSPHTPKRILSLDGGGVRGILTLGMLEKIEAIVRDKPGNKQMLLGDYYDVISGTSTGAMIAACLAKGMEVSAIKGLYMDLGKEIFGTGLQCKLIPRDCKTVRAFFSENYSSARLEGYLKDKLGETTLGDQDLKCGLIINTKRADTYSLWSLANHPDGKYYEANKDLRLWELCRASSAAPYYFKPKKLLLNRSTLKKEDRLYATFIDGGVSLANNPAWETFFIVFAKSFGFEYKCGKDKILLTSLGTGNGQKKENADKMERLKPYRWVTKLTDLFMVDASETNQALMEAFGVNEGSSFVINSQYQDGKELRMLPDEARLFSFQRHNVALSCKGLKELAPEFDFTEAQCESLREMDHYENMELLFKIGSKYAEKHIKSIL